MIAVLWLCFAVFAGWQITKICLGEPHVWIEQMGSAQTAKPFCQSFLTVLLLRLAVATSVGLLLLSWLTYGLAYLFNCFIPSSIHPLLPANLLVLLGLSAWLAMIIYKKRADLFSGWPKIKQACRGQSVGFLLAVLLFWVLFSVWLMFGTFYRIGTQIHAGYSVFSDFAPHTALVSSFSRGRNWPTEYPHFPRDGISYHFMFFFLCGNLNVLGLPIDWAINVPSLLSFLSFCVLLGFLAVRLTGRTATFFLTPLMLFFRSSAAFFTHLHSLFNTYGRGPQAFSHILSALWHQASFIGNTPNDDWGLWGINVYANQRHFLSGFSLLLIVLLIVLPDLQAGMHVGLKHFFKPDGWRPLSPDVKKRYALALLICLLLPYWHGSALIALLLILVPVALFSIHRLFILLLAVASVFSALLQSQFFSGRASRVVQPRLYFGFISADRSLPGILIYLLHVTGIALPLLAIAFFMPGRRRKILISSFLLPLIFAFTVSLTPDVTVNHKYVIISIALSNIYLADLLVRLWSAGKKPAIRARLTAIVLCFPLMITGLYECRIMENINQNTISIDSNSPLVNWITANTQPDDVFVTAPYHYHSFFLSGRSTWFGHSYYAWSAGHDTAHRYELLCLFLSGFGGDLKAVHELIEKEDLSFLMIDDTLRRNEELPLDETFFDEHFSLAVSFPGLENTKIYDLRSSADNEPLRGQMLCTKIRQTPPCYSK